MSIVAIVTTANRIYKVARQFSNRATQYNPYSRFTEHFPPNYRPYIKDIMRGADIAFSGGLITEAIDYGMNAIPKKSPKSPYQNRQTRDYMEQFSTGRKYGKNRYNRPRRCKCRQRY